MGKGAKIKGIKEKQKKEIVKPGQNATKNKERVKKIIKKGFKKTPRDDENMAAFRSQLSSCGLAIRLIPADGNCLFRSLDDQLNGTVNQENHFRLRSSVVAFMLAHSSDYEPFTENFNDYLTQLAKDGTWAGHLELSAISRLFNVDVVVHQLGAPRLEIRASKHSGDDSASKAKYRRTIHFSYHDQEHYSSVRKAENDSPGGTDHSPLPDLPSSSSSSSASSSSSSSSSLSSSALSANVSALMSQFGLVGVSSRSLVHSILVDTWNDMEAASTILLATIISKTEQQEREEEQEEAAAEEEEQEEEQQQDEQQEREQDEDSKEQNENKSNQTGKNELGAQLRKTPTKNNKKNDSNFSTTSINNNNNNANGTSNHSRNSLSGSSSSGSSRSSNSSSSSSSSTSSSIGGSSGGGGVSSRVVNSSLNLKSQCPCKSGKKFKKCCWKDKTSQGRGPGQGQEQEHVHRETEADQAIDKFGALQI